VAVSFIAFDYPVLINIKFVISIAILFAIMLPYFTNINVKYKQLLFPILILNIPGAIDNVLPNFNSDRSENIRVTIGIIQYYDIFIILYMTIYSFVYNKRIAARLNYFKNSMIVCFVLYVINFAFIYYSLQPANAYGGMLVFLRLLFLFVITDDIFPPQEIYLSYIYKGLWISVTLLLADSLLYGRYFSDYDHLTHSTLANNVFSNLLLFIYSIFKIYFKKTSIVYTLSLMLILYLTGGRSAMIILVLFELLYIMFIGKSNIATKIVTIVIFSSLLIFIIPQVISAIYLFTSGEITPEISSIYSRLSLWSLSLDMIIDNIYSGVGNWSWNYYKYDYGYFYVSMKYLEGDIFGDYLLLDAHNGYLHFMAENGIFIFVAFYSIFITSFKNMKLKIFLPFIIFLLTEIMNAGINKLQVQIFVIITLYILRYKILHKKYTSEELLS
jgi:hypothetical protein